MEFVKSNAELGMEAAELFMTTLALSFLSQVAGFLPLPKPRVL